MSFFAEAITRHGETQDLFESARTHLAFGSCLRRHRQRVEARRELRTAIESFDFLGAEPWSDFGRSELAATGESLRCRGASAWLS